MPTRPMRQNDREQHVDDQHERADAGEHAQDKAQRREDLADEAHDVARASTTKDIKERIPSLGEKRPRTLPRDGGTVPDFVSGRPFRMTSGSTRAFLPRSFVPTD